MLNNEVIKNFFMGHLFMKSRFFFVVLLFLVCGVYVKAQKVAVKTNALAWLTASPNIEVECVLGRHFSLDLGVAGNPVKAKKLQTTYVHVQPEVRYWLNRPMVSHYFGLTGFVNNFSMLFKETRHKGDAFAAGITYGYAWAIGKHWNIEANVGAGVVRYRQFKYDKNQQRPVEPNEIKTVLAPVKLGISFVYIIR